MQQNQFLLYGANGYTGELIARFASEYNLQPILAGRRKEALKALGTRLNMPYKVFDLADTAALEAALKEVKVVVHCAGPFDHTAKPMADACLKTGVHYLDINGDMDVYALLYSYNEAAKKAGVMIMSGAGFDVVPTDCTALFLKKLLPSATSLQLAFATPGGGLSHGTATTTVQKLGDPGAVRKDGKLIPVPVGHKGMKVDFGGGQKLFVMSLPWGDVYTAYLTTGIPDIESYTAVPAAAYWLLKFQFLFNWLLRTAFVRGLVKKKIDKAPPGLEDSKREKSTSLVWGKVTDKAGNKRIARLSGPDAYTLTAYCTLLIARKILDGHFAPGYQTPAGAYGEDLIMEIKGVKREVVN
ncbi:saccharopine dehydrogenase family protein [Segetibacter aerophilus]|uniref:Saccharopine dehydrogenase n=1 Tax=Segetibacter aerophilus TaxID=670293 RepID=A0A512BFI8_9BACT|nr:saccharopine dehydrogenase NADP-binding domain-containing protein [Segetibacter aerophilus]GEO10645.1 saccharopine dehydrogenase [Segetibacter aerophilus]